MTSSQSPQVNVAKEATLRQEKGSFLFRMFLLVVGLSGVLLFVVNRVHHPLYSNEHANKSAVHNSMKEFTQLYQQLRKTTKKEASDNVNKPSAVNRLATLNCDAYGGPSQEIAQEMVYWQDIPSDADFLSPFHAKRDQDKKQYMTFEPDGGGWNNIRMAMETVFALAHATGRILVMPPEQRMYLLGKQQNKQKHHFGFADFFPIDELAKEHVGLEIISMKTFLEAEAMTGHLYMNQQISFPPGNRTDWDGSSGQEIKVLKEWLRNVTHVAMWRPSECLAAFPKGESSETLQQIHDEIVQSKFQQPNKGHPVPVNSAAKPRMQEQLSMRRKLCLYDSEMQRAPVVHFMCYHKMRIRLLVHFYAFIFFESWRQDVWTKRFIRDHVRYVDEIQCAAARVVHRVRELSKINGNDQGEFDAFHVRRGDFQYKNTRLPAEEIYENSKQELQEGATVYIATDERDKTFFEPLKKHYHVLFLDDFKYEIKDLNTNYYGMLDQLVASRSRIFFGCWFSTFTGYITRLQGYHSQNREVEGFREGLLPKTYYYALKDKKHKMQQWDFFNTFAREFPVSWRDIDQGIDVKNIAERRVLG